MQTIDLKDWTLLSERATSTNYTSPDHKWFLKVYRAMDEAEQKMIEVEHHTALAVLRMGIPTPRAEGIVSLTSGGYGALYENIEGKISLSRAVSRDLSRKEECMKIFADMAKKIHTTPCETASFTSIKKIFLNALEREKSAYSPTDYRIVKDILIATPDATTCLHGDFHPGNFIMAPSGSYAIDLGNFSYGDPIFDWAQWYHLAFLISEEVVDSVFHMSKKDLGDCWNLTFQYYMEGKSEEEKSDFIRRCRLYSAFIALPLAVLMPDAKADLTGLVYLLHE